MPSSQGGHRKGQMSMAPETSGLKLKNQRLADSNKPSKAQLPPSGLQKGKIKHFKKADLSNQDSKQLFSTKD